MKNTIYIIIIFIIPLNYISQTETIKWLSWNEMIKKREQDSIKKKVFIDLYTGWCGWCKKMDKSTFIDPNVVKYMNFNYYPVKFDAETRDTIIFNNITFVNSDPNFVKNKPNSRGRTHWFAHSLLEGKLSYPSYVILDENFVRITILNGYKQIEPFMGNLVFFAKNEYKYYHNYLNGMWNKNLQQKDKK